MGCNSDAMRSYVRTTQVNPEMRGGQAPSLLTLVLWHILLIAKNMAQRPSDQRVVKGITLIEHLLHAQLP